MSSNWVRIRGAKGFGQALAMARRSARLTQAEMAERIGAERTTVLNVELGRNPAIERAVNAFAVSGYDLIAVPRRANVTVEDVDAEP